MNDKLVIFALVLGVTAALPTNNLKDLKTRRNVESNNRLGIYDGKKGNISHYNYLVSIVAEDDLQCAGAIISDSYVLTTAECVFSLSASNISVVAGSKDGTNGTYFTVENITLHPSYNQYHTGSYDFALLMIDGNFTFGDDIGSATLPTAKPKSGANLHVAGYGDTVQGGSGNRTLKQGTMKYMRSVECKHYYSNYAVRFDSTMACAYDHGRVTMCRWDFGNPFTNGTVLYGLMAAAAPDGFCTSSAIPVIIADVFTVVDWINEYI